MSGRTGRVYVLTEADKAKFASRGIPLPPAFLAPPKRVDKPSSDHIPGNCYKRRMARSVPESKGAPEGVRYALSVDLPHVNRINYNFIAPTVMDMGNAFAVDSYHAFTAEHQVYFNASTGTVEAVVSINDKEALRFYNHYYACIPDQMMKVMTGDLFSIYCEDMTTFRINGEPMIWADTVDVIHYIKTAPFATLQNFSFDDVAIIKYAGRNEHGRPANIDLARVRSVLFTYGN
jgi:hypothetical protein